MLATFRPTRRHRIERDDITALEWRCRLWAHRPDVAYYPDCVAKVESCSATNFRENQKREEIADSYNLYRATEVAYEFNVWR